MKNTILFLLIIGFISVNGQENNTEVSNDTVYIMASRTEVIAPVRKVKFQLDSNNRKCKERIQGGNPRMVSEYLVFDGSMDGNRQVDPQIAVGGGYVLHGSNKGLTIYDKKGNLIEGVTQKCFNGGIDPKLFFDPHNRVFGFDLWNPWDKEKKEERVKPVNISISETSNPTGAWNTYPVPAPKGVDGGGIGYSKKWIGYSFPGGTEQTFVMKMDEAKTGKPATIYHFKGSLGQPIFIQDPIDDLYFLQVTDDSFIITKITENKNGIPVSIEVSNKKHHLKYTEFPPKSPQKDTEQLTASGGKNPKVVVMQNGHIWFSRTINLDGRAAVEWYQLKTNGSIVQSGIITENNTNYIQTTLAVNKNNDVLIGFQETNKDMFISPRMAFRNEKDPLGTVQEIVHLGEGQGFTNGASWGDYSGSIIDGDNLTDLWTIQSITGEDGKGDTVIAKVPFN